MDKILVIDDEKATLAMLGLLLRAYGYSVLTAENAAAGLEVFEKEKPMIILTDIKMPGMDGIQLLRKIKEVNQDTEVIMITGHGDIELAIQSMKFDATDFITKPINSDVLEIALKRVTEKIKLKAEVRNYTENLEKLVEEKTRKLVEAERLAAVGQTVAGLAHAIKNVTSGLTGGMYVLETGVELGDDVYRSRGWEMIKRNVGRIERMVLDLLSYAKERQPAYQFCDPNSPAQEVFDLMRTKAGENGVAFVQFKRFLPELLSLLMGAQFGIYISHMLQNYRAVRSFIAGFFNIFQGFLILAHLIINPAHGIQIGPVLGIQFQGLFRHDNGIIESFTPLGQGVAVII